MLSNPNTNTNPNPCAQLLCPAAQSAAPAVTDVALLIYFHVVLSLYLY